MTYSVVCGDFAIRYFKMIILWLKLYFLHETTHRIQGLVVMVQLYLIKILKRCYNKGHLIVLGIPQVGIYSNFTVKNIYFTFSQVHRLDDQPFCQWQRSHICGFGTFKDLFFCIQHFPCDIFEAFFRGDCNLFIISCYGNRFTVANKRPIISNCENISNGFSSSLFSLQPDSPILC